MLGPPSGTIPAPTKQVRSHMLWLNIPSQLHFMLGNTNPAAIRGDPTPHQAGPLTQAVTSLKVWYLFLVNNCFAIECLGTPTLQYWGFQNPIFYQASSHTHTCYDVIQGIVAHLTEFIFIKWIPKRLLNRKWSIAIKLPGKSAGALARSGLFFVF